jgi:hypothetical protein
VEEGLKYIKIIKACYRIGFRFYHERDEWTGGFKAGLSYKLYKRFDELSESSLG